MTAIPSESADFMTELLETARDAARRAGTLQMQHFRSGDAVVLENPRRDLKIDVDRSSEALIRRRIHAAFPAHGILSEENGFKGHDTGYVWIVDPLDGTVNYFVGLPHYCVCIACYRMPGEPVGQGPLGHERLWKLGQPLVGVVYAPYSQWMFSAVAGRGADCNGRKLAARRHAGLTDAVVGISFGKTEATIRQMEAVNGLLVRRVKKIRILGSTGLDIALVAAGALAGIVQPHVGLWDIAAARLILEESGGALTARPNPGGGWQVIAAATDLLRPLQRIFRQVPYTDTAPRQSR